ncbi:hypothetical protein B9J77_01675 [candidate division NPL-UPA2 bacterium Unc8]|uniref:Uncharacterized protein n=1 Tax=candidate division NPL-UPA2 bacterium Unc8 TaxID=1980939 RepID=A0A399FZF7_UNCN2|nr:MAG: hypothetical protein B9J77_01675 [candidate division NPL-UPA2 bacterium Unc8]
MGETANTCAGTIRLKHTLYSIILSLSCQIKAIFLQYVRSWYKIIKKEKRKKERGQVLTFNLHFCLLTFELVLKLVISDW